MSDDLLRRLAEAVGLAAEYEDARGERRAVEHDTLAAVLQRLGLSAESDAACRESLGRVEAEAGGEALPPLVTADVGRPVVLPGQRTGTFEIVLEGGGHMKGRIQRRRGVDVLPAVSEPGYHRLLLDGQAVTLAVAPEMCFWPEASGEPMGSAWGIAAQIYALKRPGDGGIGDFTSVAELAEAAAGHGAHALAISPVHAMFAADPGRASPYSPSNRLLLNGLLLDPAAKLGADRVAQAAVAVGQAEARSRWEGAERIDWAAAGTAKLALMRRLFDDLAEQPEVAAEFRAYMKDAGSEVENHAVFEVLHASQVSPEGHRQHWRDWGADYADPNAPGVARVREERARDVEFHIFLQWLAEEGLKTAQARARDAGMPIGLIADLAVGADGGGSQAWASRSDMLTGLNMGAPPDIYNPMGQDWGLAALDPHGLRTSGFRAFLKMLRASLAWAGGIRIDHILGLHRIWVIPEGEKPTRGAYLHFPLDDLLRLVTLESARHKAVVIGEDLGTVPGGLRKKLEARRILGMSVLWFEQSKRGFLPPNKWRRESVAMTTTHDLPTVAGWWSGRDLEWREKLGLYPDDAVARDARSDREKDKRALWKALVAAGSATGSATPEAPPVAEALEHVGRTECRLALAPLEDLLAEVEQPNLPGTVDEHPNWRHRLPEEARLCRGEELVARIDAFRKGREDQAPGHN